MISAEHKKHAGLKKPYLGEFGRNEWSINGAPCDLIRSLASNIAAGLSPLYKCSYVDTDHPAEIESSPETSTNFAVAYTDKISHHQCEFTAPRNAFNYRPLFSSTDLVLVNGNHYAAKSQVVIIDQRKETSLRKKIQQLTDVQLFLLSDGLNDVFDFIKEAIPAYKEISCYRLDEKEKIISFFLEKMKQSTPILKGLVLAGGKSLRFGSDKGKINLHGEEQWLHVAETLREHCNEVFISCREEQQHEMEGSYKILTDSFTGFGPYGAILSAFRNEPDSAWLVVACDLLLLNKETIHFLINSRHSGSTATAFKSPVDGLPEPLIAIWEPKSYPLLLNFLSQGYSCPRKALINSDATLIDAPDPGSLMNVNTQEELEQAKAMLKISSEKNKKGVDANSHHAKAG
jgi:molybdopterin-guanine dinucleotide biosynthesis protein A